ncbi:hypothetical protein J6590_058173 [Homalodisca vitripennis]|nr:hypothetical protein J6590_058173 [Homalodisca vitripennis]
MEVSISGAGGNIVSREQTSSSESSSSVVSDQLGASRLEEELRFSTGPCRRGFKTRTESSSEPGGTHHPIRH